VIPSSLSITGPRRDKFLARARRILPVKSGIRRAPCGLRVDVSQPNQQLLYYYFHNVVRSYRESPLYAHMQDRLRPGDLFLDVGANLGIYSLLARELGAESWMFEPDPAHAAYLERNEAVLGRLFSVALSDSGGQLEFFVATEGNPGASSLVSRVTDEGPSIYGESVRVETRSLDDVIPDATTRARVPLLKVDVEGGEAATIAGMRDFLTERRPDVWCEVRGPQSDRAPDSYRSVIDLLRPLGYEPFIREGSVIREFGDGDVIQVFDILFMTDGHTTASSS